VKRLWLAALFVAAPACAQDTIFVAPGDVLVVIADSADSPVAPDTAYYDGTLYVAQWADRGALNYGVAWRQDVTERLLSPVVWGVTSPDGRLASDFRVGLTPGTPMRAWLMVRDAAGANIFEGIIGPVVPFNAAPPPPTSPPAIVSYQPIPAAIHDGTGSGSHQLYITAVMDDGRTYACLDGSGVTGPDAEMVEAVLSYSGDTTHSNPDIARPKPGGVNLGACSVTWSMVAAPGGGSQVGARLTWAGVTHDLSLK
jgi:hypothetical protein